MVRRDDLRVCWPGELKLPLHNRGFTRRCRGDLGLVSAALATPGTVAGESCLSSVAALAQGDSGEQRGACEQRGR